MPNPQSNADHSDASKLVFIFSVITILLVLVLFSFFQITQPNAVTTPLEKLKGNFSALFDDAESLIGIAPSHLLQPARDDRSGVTVDKAQGDNQLIFMSGFFETDNAMRLINRDGSTVVNIPVKFSEIFKQAPHLDEAPENDWSVDTHGALMLPDGSVIFNFDYAGTAKLDHCGKVEWTLPHVTHHSLEMAEDGTYWLGGRIRFNQDQISPFRPFPTPLDVDTILHISSNGKVIDEIMLPEFFYRSQLEALLTATGEYIRPDKEDDDVLEMVHLNKIGVLSEKLADDFPMFQAGDLLISLRDRNLIAVLDPTSRKVKWWQIGPWKRQHDPEFMPGGWISLFNNNTYITHGHGTGNGSKLVDPSIDHASNIMAVKPETGEVKILYGDREGEKLLSVIRSKHEILPDGHILITEFEGGRALEIDTKRQVVWEYVNRYDEAHIAEMTEVRRYPTDYFSRTDWSCPK